MEMSSRICFVLLLLTVQKDIGRMHICSCEGLGAQEKADHAVDFFGHTVKFVFILCGIKCYTN